MQSAGHVETRPARPWPRARDQGSVILAAGRGKLFHGPTDAGIFGPPGLNGTSDAIDSEIAKGVSHIEWKSYSEPVAAAVIWLSMEEQMAQNAPVPPTPPQA